MTAAPPFTPFPWPRYLVLIGTTTFVPCDSLAAALDLKASWGHNAFVYEPLAASAAERIAAEPEGRN